MPDEGFHLEYVRFIVKGVSRFRPSAILFSRPAASPLRRHREAALARTSVKRASVNATMDRCEGADFGHLCEVSETTCGAPAFVRNGEPRRRSRGEGW